MYNSNAMNQTDEHRDPFSGASGAHPIGTGAGALVVGIAAGAVAGTVAGPVGTVVGGAVGAVIGGLAGKDIAEAVNPGREDAYWRDHFSDRPYVQSGSSYYDYGPAYGFGVASYRRNPGRSFDETEPEMSKAWPVSNDTSVLSWDSARHAVRDAWNRLSSMA